MCALQRKTLDQIGGKGRPWLKLELKEGHEVYYVYLQFCGQQKQYWQNVRYQTEKYY